MGENGECVLIVDFIDQYDDIASGDGDRIQLIYGLSDGKPVIIAQSSYEAMSVSLDTYSLMKCSVNGRFYFIKSYHGVGGYSGINADQYKDGAIVNICSASTSFFDSTEEETANYERISAILAENFITPEPTHTDGDINVYIPEFENVTDEEAIF